jgi:hypothetical protein
VIPSHWCNVMAQPLYLLETAKRAPPRFNEAGVS